MGALLKAKTFIDTVVYRSAISGESWAYVGLVALGFSLTGVVIVTMPVSTLGWLGLGWDDDNPGVTKTQFLGNLPRDSTVFLPHTRNRT